MLYVWAKGSLAAPTHTHANSLKRFLYFSIEYMRNNKYSQSFNLMPLVPLIVTITPSKQFNEFWNMSQVDVWINQTLQMVFISNGLPIIFSKNFDYFQGSWLPIKACVMRQLSIVQCITRRRRVQWWNYIVCIFETVRCQHIFHWVLGKNCGSLGQTTNHVNEIWFVPFVCSMQIFWKLVRIQGATC